MKAIIPLLALLFLVGCGNNNSTDQSSSTNSVSSEPAASSINTNNSPVTNDIINNNAPAPQMTNTLGITNEASTNLPATTNQ
jgi:hypothetical protein